MTCQDPARAWRATQLASQLARVREQRTHNNERPHNKDAHLHGTRAVQHICGHDGAMLGEGVGKVHGDGALVDEAVGADRFKCGERNAESEGTLYGARNR